MESRGLHVVDWLVFAAMLAISCGIGKKETTTYSKQWSFPIMEGKFSEFMEFHKSLKHELGSV